MPPTTWKLTVTDGPEPVVHDGLSTIEARNAIAALMRGGSVPAAPVAAAPAPARDEAREETRELIAA